MNFFNDVFRPFAGLHINTADIFADNSQGKKLKTDKHEQYGKKCEYSFRRPLSAVNQSGNRQKYTETTPKKDIRIPPYIISFIGKSENDATRSN